MLLLTLILLLSPLADAFVRLQNSILYDEEDFRGVAQLTTDMCASGCKIYATIAITPEGTNVAQNIFVKNPNTGENLSISDISKRVWVDTQKKAYMDMGNAPTVTITNNNVGLISAPLALWIVSTKSPYYDDAEVFEPLNLVRPKAAAPKPITILSAYPFTVVVQPGEFNSILASTTGYDSIDRSNTDSCFAAMDNTYSGDFFGATFSINGPFLTLSFGSTNGGAVELSASNTFNFDRFPALNQPQYISSPGFVCGSATSSQVYRSSALRKNANYNLNTPNAKELMLHFDIDVASDEDHPVKILDTNNGGQGFYDSSKAPKRTVYYSLLTKSAKVSFNPANANAYFGMRVWAEDPQAAKSTTPLADTTTSSSRTHQLIVLIVSTVFVLLV